ncbi:glycosyltransferase family protein [Rothia sp. CCM 9419]|uniref:glycosyltransferase family protein n=1 Tax=Rothia sp. CCM 9419 TaxID=3402662 RepID=UPI003AE896D6
MSSSSHLIEAINYVRRAAWHLRTGGRKQLRAFTTRQHVVKGADARPHITRSSPLKTLFSGKNQHLRLDFPEFSSPIERTPTFNEYRVAVILDDFSAAAWGYEFNTVALDPSTWEEQLNTGIDLLFVESAWAGNNGAWQYQLTGKNAPSTALKDIINYCKAHHIPTIFWNKEDPPHFEDFLPTARLFDYVFTSDERKIPEYQKRLGHRNISALAFAAQKAIHNPARPPHGFHERDIAFAGMYFAHKYPERREQMDMLLGAAYAVSPTMDHGLEIFSRFLNDDPNYQFPEPFSQKIVGSLSYAKMLTAYKAYKVFLNVNSVTDSPSMCARRVFEITASGTPVLTTHSEAIPRFFTDEEVPIATTQKQAEYMLKALVNSPELNDRTVHLAQRKIWSAHTYTHRAMQVLQAAGKTPQQHPHQLPETTVIVSTNRPGHIDHVFKTVASFSPVPVQLNLLTHGFDVPTPQLQAKARDYGIELQILRADSTLSLGECLNQLVRSADGKIITKVDDDDLYGEHYLQDMLFALAYSGADIVGKQAHYMHLQAHNATLLRNPEREHKYTNFVMGPTITGTREVFLEHPFPAGNRGEDTGFLSSVHQDGGVIYSSDRFNFLQMRSGDASSHAWNVEDRELLAQSPLRFYGKGLEHLMF